MIYDLPVLRSSTAEGGRFTIWGKSVESSAVNHQSSIINHQFRRAFTLIEMLVVISILGILAALTVPALKNFGKSNVNISASRQLLDDVARARQLAISQRTTVYMVFVPTNFWDNPGTINLNTAWFNPLTPAQQTAATNLCGNQLSGYNFVAYGAMGDQPGQHAWHYLAPWQTLPDGSFIALQKFIESPVQYYTITDPVDASKYYNIYGFTNMLVPFPTESVEQLSLPARTSPSTISASCVTAPATNTSRSPTAACCPRLTRTPRRCSLAAPTFWKRRPATAPTSPTTSSTLTG